MLVFYKLEDITIYYGQLHYLGFFWKRRQRPLKLWLSQQNQEQDRYQYFKLLPEEAARNQRMTAAGGHLIPLCWSLTQFQRTLLVLRLQSWIQSDAHLQVQWKPYHNIQPPSYPVISNVALSQATASMISHLCFHPKIYYLTSHLLKYAHPPAFCGLKDILWKYLFIRKKI